MVAKRLLLGVFGLLGFHEAVDSFALVFASSFVEDLIDFEALDEFADSGEVVEGEETISSRVEEFKKLVDLALSHDGTQSLRTLPKFVFVNAARLIHTQRMGVGQSAYLLVCRAQKASTCGLESFPFVPSVATDRSSCV